MLRGPQKLRSRQLRPSGELPRHDVCLTWIAAPVAPWRLHVTSRNARPMPCPRPPSKRPVGLRPSASMLRREKAEPERLRPTALAALLAHRQALLAGRGEVAGLLAALAAGRAAAWPNGIYGAVQRTVGRIYFGAGGP